MKITPFTVLIDTNETNPYMFDQINTPDTKAKPAEIVRVKWRRAPLYRQGRLQHPSLPFAPGYTDYSLEGHEESIQIERKSRADLAGSLGGGREEFEARVWRMNQIPHAFILIECELSDLRDPTEWGVQGRVIERTSESWMIRYPNVHWCFSGGRFASEQKCFSILEMFWQRRYGEKVFP